MRIGGDDNVPGLQHSAVLGRHAPASARVGHVGHSSTRRTRSVRGDASCRGNACMPSAGSAGTPIANMRISSSVNALDVLWPSSSSTPARNRSMTRRSSPAHPTGQVPHRV